MRELSGFWGLAGWYPFELILSLGFDTAALRVLAPRAGELLALGLLLLGPRPPAALPVFETGPMTQRMEVQSTFDSDKRFRIL